MVRTSRAIIRLFGDHALSPAPSIAQSEICSQLLNHNKFPNRQNSLIRSKEIPVLPLDLSNGLNLIALLQFGIYTVVSTPWFRVVEIDFRFVNVHFATRIDLKTIIGKGGGVVCKLRIAIRSGLLTELRRLRFDEQCWTLKVHWTTLQFWALRILTTMAESIRLASLANRMCWSSAVRTALELLRQSFWWSNDANCIMQWSCSSELFVGLSQAWHICEDLDKLAAVSWSLSSNLELLSIGMANLDQFQTTSSP